ncbi:MAG: ATP-binding protein [Opitutaceae bacterium]|nr:ATP-binding protein [Opitutaceae bacterium]
MIAREMTALVRARLKDYPAVGLVGPRQTGKTTLARELSAVYFDLEQPAERIRLDLQWDGLMKQKKLVVLDEAQAWPEVFPRLRGAIDAERKRVGRFLLLGSVSPALMRQVSESLAGRLGLVELAPLLSSELPDVPLAERWLRGGFPEGGVAGGSRFPQWQLDYLTLLAQRDLPVWGLPAKPAVTDRLLHMTAAVHGQIWNASQVGQSLGLSYHTVNSYVDFLEGAFLLRRLPPWLPNLKKRLVRSPRVYWRDSGLLHALLGVREADELLHQPWVGASWEGFVIGQVVETLAARGVVVMPHYFRTADGYEVDLVFKLGRRLWAVEVKLTSSPAERDFARFNAAADLIGADRRVLVAQVAETTFNGKAGVATLPGLLELLAKEIA